MILYASSVLIGSGQLDVLILNCLILALFTSLPYDGDSYLYATDDWSGGFMVLFACQAVCLSVCVCVCVHVLANTIYSCCKIERNVINLITAFNDKVV